MRRLLIPALCVLLVAEAAFYGFISWTVAAMTLEAKNAPPNQPLPDVVWSYAVDALVLVLLAILLGANVARSRLWFVGVAVGFACYGGWEVAASSQYLRHWSDLFTADIFALETVSGSGFVAIGVLEVARRVLAHT